MTPPPPHQQLEAELTAHASALRSLARFLVGESAADDLVQDTALKALSRPPRSATGLRGWLAQILRRQASHLRRAGGRRERHEAALEAPAPQPPADRVVEHHESVQRLTAALLQLPEPYHGTLLLRFFEDLTPSQIAASTCTPIATVKSRLQRGIAMLRERLDSGAPADPGGAAKDWRAGLSAAFGLPMPNTLGGAVLASHGILGGLLMGTIAKWTCGVVGALALLWLVFVPQQRDQVPPNVGTSANAPLASAGASAGPGPTTSEADSRKERVAAPLLGAATEGATTITLRGRLVDEQRLPLGGIDVSLRGVARDEGALDAWTKDHDEPEPIDLQQTTGDDGRFAFRFESPPPLQYFLSMGCPSRVVLQCRFGGFAAGHTEDLGDLVMPLGAVVQGRVLDRRGARPAKLRVFLRGADEVLRGPTVRREVDVPVDAAGAFWAPYALPPGEYRIAVRGATNVQPERLVIDGSAPRIDLALEVDLDVPDPSQTLRGVVVDPDGVPVARASVGVGSYQRGTDGGVSTDASGTFELKMAPRSPAEVSLSVEKDGYEPLTTSDQFRWGRSDVRLVLERGSSLEVAVVGSDGMPVEQFQVRVVPVLGATGRLGGHHVRSRGRHEGGVATVSGLARGDYFVLAEPKGELHATSELVPVTLAGPRTRTVVPLSRLAVGCVRVQSAAGQPIRGTRVELADMRGHPATADSQAYPLSSALWTQQGCALVRDEGVTDPSGEVTLRAAAGQPRTLFVRGPGHAPFVVEGVLLHAEQPVVVTVPVGSVLIGESAPLAAIGDLQRLAGPARTGDGVFGPGPFVRLGRMVDGHEESFPRTPERLGDDGRFVIRGAPAGRWSVCVGWFEPVAGDHAMSVGKHAVLSQVDLVDGKTEQVVLDLAPLRTGELDAQVLLDGKPAANTNIALETTNGVDLRGSAATYVRHVTTDATGRLRTNLRAGEYRLTCWSERMPLRAPASVVVVAGQVTSATFALEFGMVRIVLVDGDGAPVRGVRIDARPVGAPDDDSWTWLPRTDDGGSTVYRGSISTYALALLPARLQDPAVQQKRLLDGGGTLVEQLVPLGTVTVRSGETTELRLVVPDGYHR